MLQLPARFRPTHETGGLPGYPARDIFGKPGTPVGAPADGVIARLSGQQGGPGGGGPFGYSIYLLTRAGQYFLTHFGSVDVEVGQRVKRGTPLGTVANYPDRPDHIHEGFDPDIRSRVAWLPCTLTWYDPALGGTNSGTGRRDPHASTASGEPYNATAFTCAAPSEYPFGTRITFRYRRRTVTCRVNDRGGAIHGSHFDLSKAAARHLGILSGGIAQARFSVVGGPAATIPRGTSRPGGSKDDDGGDSAAIDSIFASYVQGGTPGAQNVNLLDDIGKDAGKAWKWFKTPPDFKGAIKPFKESADAINNIGDFLKWVSWIFHPRNVLRSVEFVTGLVLMAMGIHTMYEVYRNAPESSAVSRAGSGAREAFRYTPPGRALQARRVTKHAKRRERSANADKRARESAQRAKGREQRKRLERTARGIKKEDIPF